jgi:hypothetical protein
MDLVEHPFRQEEKGNIENHCGKETVYVATSRLLGKQSMTRFPSTKTTKLYMGSARLSSVLVTTFRGSAFSAHPIGIGRLTGRYFA